MSKIRKGFTLIEVAVVLVVLAILAAIAIPTFSAFMDGVADRAVQAEADAFVNNVRANDALDGVAGNLSETEIDTIADENGGVQSPAGTITFTGDRGQSAVVTYPLP